MKRNLFSIKNSLSTLAIIVVAGFSGLKAQCNADFTYTVGAAGSVTFESTSTGTTANTMYNWNFGDYNSYSGPSTLNHTYTDNFVMSVQLQILDSAGAASCSSSMTKTIAITNAPCTQTLNFGENMLANGVVNFYAWLSPYYTYAWNFGDGTTGNTLSPSHTYTASGVYNISVTATSYSSICTYTAAQTITVTVAPCGLTADFTYSLGPNGFVNFFSTTIGTATGSIYLWNFGDGGSSNGTSVSHTFLNNGTYNVIISATDSTGYNGFPCTDTTMHQITVSNFSCTASANFSLNKDTTQALHWIVYPTYPGNISSATWSWGDGSTTGGLYPSHTYSAAGVYNICLSIIVSCGSSTTICTSSNIYRTANTNQIVSIDVVQAPNNATGISSFSSERRSVSISPNPNNANFNLTIQGADKNKNVDITILNLLGEKVYSETVMNDNTTFSKDLNLKGLAQGTYFVKLQAGNKNYISKMIITK